MSQIKGTTEKKRAEKFVTEAAADTKAALKIADDTREPPAALARKLAALEQRTETLNHEAEAAGFTLSMRHDGLLQLSPSYTGREAAREAVAARATEAGRKFRALAAMIWTADRITMTEVLARIVKIRDEA